MLQMMNYKKLLSNNYTKTLKTQEPGVRCFQIAKYVFFAVPLVVLGYLYLISVTTGNPFFSSIFENPLTTILFIEAMVLPYCGVITDKMVKNFSSGSQVRLSRQTLLILAVSQFTIGNLLSGGLLAYGLYKQEKPQAIAEGEQKKGGKQTYLILAASATILLISLFCTAVLLRVGGIN